MQTCFQHMFGEKILRTTSDAMQEAVEIIEDEIFTERQKGRKVFNGNKLRSDITNNNDAAAVMKQRGELWEDDVVAMKRR